MLPDDEIYLAHWSEQHGPAYIKQIFHVDTVLSPQEAKEMLSGGALGLLSLTDVEED